MWFKTMGKVKEQKRQQQVEEHQQIFEKRKTEEGISRAEKTEH